MAGGTDEVHALAQSVLDAAGVAHLGLTVSYDDGTTLRHVYVNEAAGEILGYTAEDLVGEPTDLPFGPDGRGRLEDLLERWRRGDLSPAPFETEAVRKDGTRVPVEVAFSAVTLAGEPAMVAFLRDIGERKAAEEALRKSESRFRQLIEAAPDAIAVIRGGRFVYVNPTYVRLLGRPFEEIRGFPVADFVHRDDREGLERRLAAFEARVPGVPTPGSIEVRVARPDGKAVFAELMGILIEYDGHPAVLDFARDTTERRQMQAQLAFSDRMATLGMLAAGVAHEINNPLTYAMLNLNGLSRQLNLAEPAEGRDSTPAMLLASVTEGLARVASIVRDLLGFSAPSSVDRWPVDAEAVLESAINVAMHAIRGKAHIVRRYSSAPPLKTDPARLGQILLNLLFNAAQSFDVADEARNELALEVTSPGPEEVAITVADNGRGIPSGDLERIFEPFYTTKPRGTGLGLSMCQTLIASLQGSIEVESAPGEGTRFVVRLPTRRSAA